MSFTSTSWGEVEAIEALQLGDIDHDPKNLADLVDDDAMRLCERGIVGLFAQGFPLTDPELPLNAIGVLGLR